MLLINTSREGTNIQMRIFQLFLRFLLFLSSFVEFIGLVVVSVSHILGIKGSRFLILFVRTNFRTHDVKVGGNFEGCFLSIWIKNHRSRDSPLTQVYGVGESSSSSHLDP